MLEKVFIVVQRIAHDGETVMRVFGDYKNAVKYADELTAEIPEHSQRDIDYDVFEREVY